MTPEEFKAARATLGLSAAALAEKLKLGKEGGRSVRRWEAGDAGISGPVELAIELLLLRQAAASGCDKKALLWRLGAA